MINDAIDKAILNDSVLNHLYWIKTQILFLATPKIVINSDDVKISLNNEKAPELLSKIDEQINQRIQNIKNSFY